MNKIQGYSLVTFQSSSNNTNNQNNKISKNQVQSSSADSFEHAVKHSESNGILSKLVEFFSFDLNLMSNQERITKKYEKFISKAENKITDAKYKFSEINENAKVLYDEAQCLLDEVNDDGFEDNSIKTYTILYKGSKYSAIAKLDEQGCIDKIIQAKDGKIANIYDFKTPVKSETDRLYSGDSNQIVTADCYFYDNNADNSTKITFLSNIKNTIMRFNSVYDAQKGGINRVSNNYDNSPIEILTTGTEGYYFNYFYNYGSKKEEIVSDITFKDGLNKTTYQKSKFILGIEKTKETKTYSCYTNTENQSLYNLRIDTPYNVKREYDW